MIVDLNHEFMIICKQSAEEVRHLMRDGSLSVSSIRGIIIESLKVGRLLNENTYDSGDIGDLISKCREVVVVINQTECEVLLVTPIENGKLKKAPDGKKNIVFVKNIHGKKDGRTLVRKILGNNRRRF